MDGYPPPPPDWLRGGDKPDPKRDWSSLPVALFCLVCVVLLGWAIVW